MIDKMVNQDNINHEEKNELSAYEKNIVNKLNAISESLDEAYQKCEERLDDEKKESIQKVYFK